MAKRRSDPTQSTGPYTEADYIELRAIRDGVARLLPEIAAAEGCGVKCDEFRSIAAEIDQQLGQIEQRFMGQFAP